MSLNKAPVISNVGHVVWNNQAFLGLIKTRKVAKGQWLPFWLPKGSEEARR